MKIRAKCIQCKYQWDLSPREVLDARVLGVPTCPKCLGIALVNQVAEPVGKDQDT